MPYNQIAKPLLLGIFIASTAPSFAKGLLENDQLEIEINLGKRLAHPVAMFPGQVVLISRDAIKRSSAKTVSELLRGHAGLQVVDLRGDGGDTYIGLRGFSQTANANVLVLLDGRRLNYADGRNPDLGHLMLDEIQQIKILNGSAGVLYGDQAVGGVIHITTNQANQDHAQIKTDLGSHNRKNAQFIIFRSADHHTVRLSGQQLDIGGYRKHSGKKLRHLSSYFNRRYAQGRAFFEYRYTEDDLQLPGALIQSEYDANRRQVNSGFINDFSHTDISVTRLGIEHALSDQWELASELNYRTASQRLTQSFRDNPSPPGGYSQRHTIELRPRLIGRFNGSARAQLILGADIRNSNYRIYIPNIWGGTNRANDQDLAAWYVQATLPVNPALSMTTGLRGSTLNNKIKEGARRIDNKDRVQVMTWGLNYRINPHTHWYLRRDENFRFAKIDELAYSDANILDTQTGLSLETGLAWDSPQLSLEASMYRLKLKNEIAYDPISYQNINLDNTVRKGFNLTSTYHLTPKLELGAHYTYTQAVLKLAKQGNKRVPGLSPQLLTLRAHYRPQPGWSWNSELQLVSKQYPFGDDLNQTRQVGGYGLVNTSVQYHRPSWEIKLNIDNLLDKKYAEYVGDSGFGRFYYPSLRRSLLLSIAYHF